MRRIEDHHENMWVGRAARRDLARALGRLATMVSKWGPLEDKKLHRLMCYMHHSRGHRQLGFIGDERSDLRLGLVTDAVFAGCKKTCKSTSGVFLAAYRPHLFYPIDYLSRKQTSTSLSTTEAETVACCLGSTAVGLPALELWSQI